MVPSAALVNGDLEFLDFSFFRTAMHFIRRVYYFCFAGSVDAFAAVLGGSEKIVVKDQIFVFDVVNINIRNGFNNTTGIFLPLTLLF